MLQQGQGLLLETDYADGGAHNKKRTFLVINSSKSTVHILNVSSLRGKERKLGFKSNKRIRRYRPPFLKPSFVKLDALYILENDYRLEAFLLNHGIKLLSREFNEILYDFNKYKSDNKLLIKNISLKEIFDNNLSSRAQSAMTTTKNTQSNS